MPTEYRTKQNRLGMQRPAAYPVGNLDYLVSEHLAETAPQAKALAARAVLASASAVASAAITTPTRKEKYIPRHSKWNANQGQTPRCVGYSITKAALAQRLIRQARDGSLTLTVRDGTVRTYENPDALADAVYERARTFDQANGNNFDEGATMWAGGMAARELGICREFRWGQDVADLINALLNGYVPIAGTDWRAAMSEPVALRIGSERIAVFQVYGDVEGGHAYAIPGADIDDGWGRIDQTWGEESYGVDGYARVPLRQLNQLLASGGELLILVGDPA
jgi:hypothetical protein